MNINIRIFAVAALLVAGGLMHAMQLTQIEQKDLAAQNELKRLEKQLAALGKDGDNMAVGDQPSATEIHERLLKLQQSEGAQFNPNLYKKIKGKIETAERFAQPAPAKKPGFARALFQ